ncbi:hypothetical protein D3C81_1082890 [compost metagenome]
MQGVDEQGDQQDQADHQALDHPHFALNGGMLTAHTRFKLGDGLLYGGDALEGAARQRATLLDLLAGTLQFARVAFDQAVELALERHTVVFGLGAGLGFQAHQGGKVIGARGVGGGHAQQRQLIEQLGLGGNLLQFALDFVGQFATAAADQFVAGQGQPRQMQGGIEQRRGVAPGVGTGAALGIVGQLFEAGAQFAFGLEQQGLGIAGQLAGAKQFVGGEALQVVQARAQARRKVCRQFFEFALQGCGGLQRRGMAQGVAAAQVVLDIACRLVLELLRQRQVALHQ